MGVLENGFANNNERIGFYLISSRIKTGFLIVMTIVLTAITMIVIFHYGTVVKKVYPPEPVIVSQKVSDESSQLFEYSVKVEAVIRNDGGDGDIVYEATVYQDGNSWTKPAKKYFGSKETNAIELQFDEVELLNGDFRSSSKVYSFGK
ncbi:MAG TPA: hypothetical protein VLN45_02105 [Ignavibacteriaceae bacterium]|nr:hypothetical protein [Ignavibacteriaceae bacterium]